MTSVPVRFLVAAGLAMVPALSEAQPELKIAPQNTETDSKNSDYPAVNKTSLKLDLGHCDYLKTIRELRNSSKEYPVLDPSKLNGILSSLEDRCDHGVSKPENNNQGMCLRGNGLIQEDKIMGHINDTMESNCSPQIKNGLSEIERILDSMNALRSSPNHVEDILDVLQNINGVSIKDDQSSQDIMLVLDSLNTPPLSCEDGEVKGELENVIEFKPVPVTTPEVDLQSKHQDLVKRQERLVGRFRNIVVQESSKHISSEISLFMNYTKNNFKLNEIREKILKSGNQSTCDNTSGSLSSLNGASDKPHPKKYRYFGAGVCRTQADQKVEVKLNEKIGRNIREVSERWLWNLKSLKSVQDPYATDSSSGGESDNDDGYFQEKVEKKDGDGIYKDATTKTLYERSVWRWARERSAIASRWTWLQSQVMDLEGHIDHYSDLGRKVRAQKKVVELAPVPDEDPDCGSSRTRSLVNSGKSFQRRKLVQSTLKKGPKCAQYRNPGRPRLTVNCGCLLENSACFLCGGENKRVKAVDSETSGRERIAEIDGAFHSVLSATNETPLSVHIDSLIQTGEWKTLQRAKPIPESLPSLRTELDTATSRPETLQAGKCDRKRHLQRHSSLPQPSSDKGLKWQRFSESQESDYRESPLPANGRQEKSLQLCETSRHKRKIYDDSDLDHADSPSSPAPSTSSAEASSGTRTRDRNFYSESLKRRAPYDIDQILIPYSVAAATRVQILQYKEILTPSWRESAIKPDLNIQASELEESTAEVEYKQRHDRSEVKERRKFYSKPGQSSTAEKDFAKKIRRTDSVVSDRIDTDESICSPNGVRSLFNGDLNERRRNSSNSQLRSGYESASSIDIEEGPVPTFPGRKFPLSDVAYHSMLREMETADEDERTRRKRPKLTAGQITDEWNSNDESDDDKWLG